MKVLIVDDELPIRQWLEFCIGKLEGYAVVAAAANGAEGYSAFRKFSPDIVITDIRMPVMDGLEMLKMIRNLDPGVTPIILTSHEDFEYARQAMKSGASEYVLKTEITEESLRRLLLKASTKASQDLGNKKQQLQEEVADRNHFLRSLLLNRNTDVVSEGLRKEYGIFQKEGELAALDVMTDGKNVVKWVLPEEGILEQAIKIPIDLNHTMIVGTIRRESAFTIGRQQEELVDYCQLLFDQAPCRIGCSDIYGNTGQIGKAMCQAYDRVMLSFYHTKEKLFRSRTSNFRQLSGGERYKMMFSRELVGQNFSKAVMIRDQMMEDVRREEPADIEYLKKLYLSFVTSLFHITRDYVESAEILLAEVETRIMAAGSLEELDQMLIKEFEVYGSGLTRKGEYSAPVRNAVSYLEEHYPETVTLSDVASHVGLSPEYLSRLFKEETGVKFVVYLNNVRLRHALHLLETTNQKVYEIAEQTGYSNLSYFSTVFKKNFGQNPFDYKNKWNSQEN